MSWGLVAVAGATIVGGALGSKASSDASKASSKASASASAITKEAADRAKKDSTKLFSQAREDSQRGFQGALDVFSQSLPAQTQVFQQGNIAAQEQLLAGLPQFQNAILGGNIDFSQLQPTQVQTPDLGFFSQTLPGLAPPSTPNDLTGLPQTASPSTQFQGSSQHNGFIPPGTFGGQQPSPPVNQIQSNLFAGADNNLFNSPFGQRRGAF